SARSERPPLRSLLVALLLVSSALLAGCSDKLGLSKASIDAPSFDLSPEAGDASTTFHLDAGALSKYNGTWDFGDGTVKYGASADQKYGLTSGKTTVTLIVTESSGKQGTATRAALLGNRSTRTSSVRVPTDKS